MIEGQEQTAHWHGKGAALLGLEGTVAKEDFERLCDNLHPKSGLQLTAKHLENRRVGYDLLSVSQKASPSSTPLVKTIVYQMNSVVRCRHDG
ncbi:IncW plasmid conjugative relaxase protein TrwC (TraI) [Fimbriiglobus ruber]|uniref:IncW plasmid conjugative relaxase protein TrwC (TraI) n=1 Tax=Fimbriiglobus ruber TaxID=1908690 RepID=A0A225DCZ8_9BACT|nr:IncW plasmid conjugative relaxase protein TrwC (TraI) [Fimbriiglobus ruber]